MFLPAGIQPLRWVRSVAAELHDGAADDEDACRMVQHLGGTYSRSTDQHLWTLLLCKAVDGRLQGHQHRSLASSDVYSN